MQIYNSLADYGFAEDILAIWRKEIGKGLLPVQAKAVNQYGLFKGQNLIVFSPTSSSLSTQITNNLLATDASISFFNFPLSDIP